MHSPNVSTPRVRPRVTAGWREASELQALVMERRELIAKQKLHQRETGSRALHMVRELQKDPGAGSEILREAASRLNLQPPPVDVVGDADAACLNEGNVESPTGGGTVSDGAAPPPSTPQMHATHSTEPPLSAWADNSREKALRVQMSQQQGAIVRTRLAAERTARMAAQSHAETGKLQDKLNAHGPRDHPHCQHPHHMTR